MEKLEVKEKMFVKCIDHATIQAAVKKIADRLNKEYCEDVPVFISVLNGAFMFTADLLKEYKGFCELAFITVSSYKGTQTTGKVELVLELAKDIRNRRVIILEDIVDSGITASYLISKFAELEPKDVKVATFLLKPEALKTEVRPDYVGIEIPNDFIIGYGLDYDGYGRNYKDIYKVLED